MEMIDSATPAELATRSSFDFKLPNQTRLVFGVNSVERVGELAREIGAKKILLVTDAGIVAAGHAKKVVSILSAAGLQVAVFDKAKENPTTRCVDDCVAFAKATGIDSIVGLGGGSSMDTAKGCNFILTNGGRMQDYWGVGKATKPMLPLIAIPTTAGTGSECQSAALITDEKTHQKMACLDPKAAARVAILDPMLTLSQPARVTACTGIDAIAHALETAVTTKRNALSSAYSREAFRLCVKALPKIFAEPKIFEARSQMQLGAAFAGVAIENSMLGAAHAAANPLTAHYGIVHGEAVGLMLPFVVKFNSEDLESRVEYEKSAAVAKLFQRSNGGDAVSAIIQHLESLQTTARLPRRLRDCGVEREKLKTLADDAAKQWTAGFNPRKVSAEDFLRFYEAAF